MLLPYQRCSRRGVCVLLGRKLSFLNKIRALVPGSTRVLLGPGLLGGTRMRGTIVARPIMMKTFTKVLHRDKCRGVILTSSYNRKAARTIVHKAKVSACLRGCRVPTISCSRNIGATCPRKIRTGRFVLPGRLLRRSYIVSLDGVGARTLRHVANTIGGDCKFVCKFRGTGKRARCPDTSNFTEVLVSLGGYITPGLCIVSKVITVRNGKPNSKSPIPVGVLLVSASPITLSDMFDHLICLGPRVIPAGCRNRGVKLNA